MKMTLSTLTTYQDLLNHLLSMQPEELNQEIMVLPPNPSGEPVRLEPVLAIGTVTEMEVESRSAKDFSHKPEQVVLLRDYSPFSEDGDSYWRMDDNGTMTGNKTGKVIRPFGVEGGD